MFCTACGYALTSQDQECPRCARYSGVQVQHGSTGGMQQGQEPSSRSTVISPPIYPNSSASQGVSVQPGSSTSLNRTNLNLSHNGMAGWAVAGVLGLFLCAAALRGCIDSPSSSGNVTQTESKEPAIPRGPSFTEVDSRMDDRKTNLTEAQKQAYWSSVAGTLVSWSGEVVEVTLDGGGRITLKCNPQTWTSDVTVEMDGKQSDRLPLISKGQRITIEGILRSHSMTGYTVSDAYVLNL